MEDSISIKSNDSTAVSDEFEIVNGSTAVLPQLNIPGDGSYERLWESLGEMINEDITDLKPVTMADTSGGATRGPERCRRAVIAASGEEGDMDHPLRAPPEPVVPEPTSPKGEDKYNKDTTIRERSSPEKDDTANDEEDVEEISDVPQDCTIFGGVCYLGSASINAPKSETEIQRNMMILNEQSSEECIKVSVSIPSCSDGSVVLYDTLSSGVIARYSISKILYYAYGKPGSSEAACFAFTLSHGDTIESSIFQCHVFRCDIPEAVGQVSSCFMKAFQRVPRSMTTSVNGELPVDTELCMNSTNQMFLLELAMELKEDDGKGGYSSVPRDRSCFKLRCNVEKQVCLQIKQVTSESQKKLVIKRCFGVLIAHGRHVRHGDMQLLDMISMGNNRGDEESGCYEITARWDPNEPAFAPLNTEIARDLTVYLTVAVDLVMKGISEPVRLLVETQVRVYHQNERFWYFNRRNLIQQFYLNVKEVPNLELPGEPCYEVLSIESSGEIDRNRLNLTLNNLASYIRSPSISSIDAITPREEYFSDGDAPMLSGTGEVSKDCSVGELESWREVLTKWTSNGPRPKQLGTLVRQGIPEALRGEIWQRLANTQNDIAMLDSYRILIAQESPCESVIRKDINRTFPAHDFFKEGNEGGGQDALFKISKAYAVYDTEVGYCQGLTFLAATLLLHMPEEQAFCVLVKLMYTYGLRDLYKDGLEALYLRLYQLNRLMEEQLPQLYQHFRDKGVESHMFASQWFLTLFTARFPLYFVFHIIDVFLLQGNDTLFQVALALLMAFKRDLLQLDFEGTLKYFRVVLPKKCRNDEVARNIMKLACSIKLKKLKKYEQEFLALKEAQENVDQYSNELEKMKSELSRSEEEKKLLEGELSQVKDMLKREVQKAESDNTVNASIISGYKQICQRLDTELQTVKSSLNNLRAVVANCEKCSSVENNHKSSTEGEPNDKCGDTELIQRITELEVELARAKLAQVEAECLNQDLNHQLGATLAELATARGGSWQPWLSKTLTSIKEAAVNKTTSISLKDAVTTKTGVQRRESAPADSTSTPTSS